MLQMKRDSFIFYRSFLEAIKALPEAEQTQLLIALIDYALNGEEVDSKLSGYALGYFALMKPQIDANNKKFKNGKKGGRPKIKENQEITENKPKENQEITESEPNVNDNVNDNDNENENENDKEKNSLGIKKEISFSEKFALFKTEALRPNNPWGKTIKKNNCILDLGKVLDQFYDWLIETGGEAKFINNDLNSNKGWFKNALDRFYDPKSQITIGPTEYLRDGKRYFRHYANEFEVPLSMPPRPGVDYIIDKEHSNRWKYVGF